MPNKRSLNFFGNFNSYEGYAGISEVVALSIKHKTDVNLRVFPYNIFDDLIEKARIKYGLSLQFSKILEDQLIDENSPYYYYDVLDSVRVSELQKQTDNLFINTMYESSLVPDIWLPYLNSCKAVIVPTNFIVESMRDSGVTTPIEVIPEGYDPIFYKYFDREISDEIKCLYVGSLHERKNWRVMIEGWKKAFKGVKNATLTIKTIHNPSNYVSDDPRIILNQVKLPRVLMPRLYGDADILICPGSEGFGMPLIEGMATGIPVLALNTEGQKDVCDDAKGLLFEIPGSVYEKANCIVFSDSDVGYHWMPSVDDIADRLDYIHRNRQEAKEIGRKASEWVPYNRNIWDKGPSLISILEKYNAWN